MNNLFLGQPSKKIIEFIEKQHFFWLEAEEDGLTIEFSCSHGSAFPDNVHVSVSRDRKSWTAYDGYLIEGLKKGDRVYFRAGHPDDPNDFKNERMCIWISEYEQPEEYLQFKFNSIKVKACGNLNCLLQKYGKVDQLASYCYSFMFYGCTSLASAPQLPATKLASSCYSFMFYGCTSLTSAPQLPAIELALNCYYYMFCGCTQLSSINVSFFDWNPPTNSTINWVSNVASNGTFICPAALPQTRGYNYIPNNWTIMCK